MNRLEANKIHGPLGVGYYIETEQYPHRLFRKKEDVIKYYGPKLLEILETKGVYKSPEIDKSQLLFSFPTKNENQND